jgi:hypothetical protein
MKRQGPTLRVIAGDFDLPLHINGITLRLSALERKMPPVQALVVEQDSGLLLDENSPFPLTLEGKAAPSDILQAPEFDYPPGTVLPKRGQPLRLYTVIHDLERHPSWSAATLELALDNLFALLPMLGISRLAMPALAHRHGALPIETFLTLLGDYLAHHPLPWSGELWLLLPRVTLLSSLAALRTLCDIHQPG